MKKIVIITLAIYLLALAASGCSLINISSSPDSPSPDGTGTVSPEMSAYPGPIEQASIPYAAPGAEPLPYPGAGELILGYPGPELQTYPGPSIPRNTPVPVDVKPFLLDIPIIPGSTVVTGSGPAGIPILIVDVTFMGEIMGEGTISSDGKFSINLTIPVPENHIIGLALGDLKGTQWEFNEFADPGFMGAEPQQIPMVGFLYDSYFVETEK